MSSRYEGLPMIMLEAQAYGIPIVAFNCKCGPMDIITDGINGYLVDEGNCEKLAQKLATLIEDDKLRAQMGKEAHINSNRYSEENIMRMWTTLFQQLKGE